MKPYYPIVYLLYQFIFILFVSIFNNFSPDVYIVLGILIVYLVAVIVMRPYNMTSKVNGFIHNITLIVNQLTVIITVAIIIRWNAIYCSNSQFYSNTEFMAYFFVIIVFLIITLVLAIVRLIIFRKEINKCCGNNEQDEDDEKSRIFEMEDKTMKEMGK